MVGQKNIYKCDVCGSVMEVYDVGSNTFNCCKQDMILESENTQEASLEKHIPVLKIEGDKIMVIVGEVEHPMDENHFIVWIQVITSKKTFMKYLTPEDRPSTSFIIPLKDDILKVRAYCNLHGLWSKEI